MFQNRYIIEYKYLYILYISKYLMAANRFENSRYYIPPPTSSANNKSQPTSSMTNVTEVMTNPKPDAPVVRKVSIGSSSARKKDIRAKAESAVAVKQSAEQLTAKGYSSEGVAYSTSGKGYSQRPTVPTNPRTTFYKDNKPFTAAPETVVKSATPSILGVQSVTYYSGKKETIKTGTTTLYNKEYLSGSSMFTKPSFGKKVSQAYSSAESSVSQAIISNVEPRIIGINKVLKGKPSQPSNELFSVKVPAGGFVKSVTTGAYEQITQKPIGTYGTVVAGVGLGKALNIPIIAKGTNTVVGRGIGTLAIGATTFSVAKGYTASKNKGEFIGREAVSFGAFGAGFSSSFEGLAFKKGTTLLADVKRGTGKVSDLINPYAIKSEPMAAFERGRTLPEGTIDVANVPSIGQVKFKPIASQQAGIKELKQYQGKEVSIISTTSSNPYRSPLLKGFGIKKTYQVIESPGASADRLKVGNIERGQFYSLPEKGGSAQAYTYYIGEGATLKDLSSGKAKFSLFSTNKALVETTTISPYSKGLLKTIPGLSPSKPNQLKVLRYYAAKENVAGTTRGGFAGVAGYRTELESISAVGSIKTRTIQTARGKYGKYFGLGDYYVRLSSGKKVEVYFQKSEAIKTKSNVTKIKETKLKSISKDVAKFDVSSSKSLRYSPYKDITLSSLGSFKSSKASSKVSTTSNISSNIKSSRSSLSKLSSGSNLSSIKSSVVSSAKSFKSSTSGISSSKSTSSIRSSSSFYSSKSYPSIKYTPPTLQVGISQSFKSSRFSSKPSKIKYDYSPSVEAAVFNIKGKAISKSLASSGLVLRPIRG